MAKSQSETEKVLQSKGRRSKQINQFQIQSMVWIGIIFLVVFAYIPMYGITIAFKDYNIMQPLSKAPWVGVKYFKEFLTDPALKNTLRNTLVLNGLGLVLSFPAPILLAILITEIRNVRFRKVAQTISYLPHFMSWVIYSGIILEMLSPKGVVSYVAQLLGFVQQETNFMARGQYFYIIYTIAGIVKSVGYGSILYVAAITGIDQELFEAATVDGCNRFQKIIYVTLPSIVGTVVVMLILQISAILNTGYEQIILLQNPMNLRYSETIDTYVYKVGIVQARFSYATAVGMLKSLFSILLMAGANKTTKKLVGRGLF